MHRDVGVRDEDELGVGGVHSPVGAGAIAEVGARAHDADRRVAVHGVGRPVGRGVVDDDHLGDVLGPQRRHESGQRVPGVVIHHDHGHRRAWRGGPSGGPVGGRLHGVDRLPGQVDQIRRVNR